MIIYIIGVIVAAIMIGRNLCKRNNGEEYSGDILCYIFSLLSWGMVFVLLMAKLYENLSKKISNDRTQRSY